MLLRLQDAGRTAKTAEHTALITVRAVVLFEWLLSRSFVFLGEIMADWKRQKKISEELRSFPLTLLRMMKISLLLRAHRTAVTLIIDFIGKWWWRLWGAFVVCCLCTSQTLCPSYLDHTSPPDVLLLLSYRRGHLYLIHNHQAQPQPHLIEGKEKTWPAQVHASQDPRPHLWYNSIMVSPHPVPAVFQCICGQDNYENTNSNIAKRVQAGMKLVW